MSPVPSLLPPPPPVGHVAVMRASRREFVGVFVEGPSDVSMWRRWLRWMPVSAGGKHAVIAAIESLARAGIPGCVGIVDSDFDRVEGIPAASNDVVASESHDLECDLVRSPALDAVLAEVPDETAVGRLIGAGTTFRDAIEARALPFGLLRWVFGNRGLPFEAGRLSPFTFVDKATWTLREDALCTEAAGVLGIARNDLDAELSARRARAVDAWQVCNGHDLVALLAVALRDALGARKKFSTVDSVSAALRIGLDSADCANLALWRDLGDWEVRRAPWVVRR